MGQPTWWRNDSQDVETWSETLIVNVGEYVLIFSWCVMVQIQIKVVLKCGIHYGTSTQDVLGSMGVQLSRIDCTFVKLCPHHLPELPFLCFAWCITV